MTRRRSLGALFAGRGGGAFPHQASFILELPLRRLLLSPGTLAGRLPLTPGSRVLEVGPGSGFYSVEVARSIPAGRMALLDLQPEMLVKARTRMRAAGLRNVGYVATDARRLPFEDASFDVVFLVTVLGEVSEKAGFLDDAHRVLRQEGILSVSEHLPDPDFIPFARLKPLAECHGFELAERFGPRWSYTANFTRPAAARPAA